MQVDSSSEKEFPPYPLPTPRIVREADVLTAAGEDYVEAAPQNLPILPERYRQ
jgi:hypothetical protein